MPRRALVVVNPPEANIVDDLVASALLLRQAASTCEGAIAPLCMQAAGQLERHAATLRSWHRS